MEVNVGVLCAEVNSRFSCAALSHALRQVTTQPNALTISDAASATLCCDIATVRRVSTNPGLFVLDSYTTYAVWHAPCVVTRVDAICTSNEGLVAKAIVFFQGGKTMQWTTPSYTDMRFGFEVTMYIATR
jgi:coenzyme PQQ precursor peptide PqqA